MAVRQPCRSPPNKETSQQSQNHAIIIQVSEGNCHHSWKIIPTSSTINHLNRNQGLGHIAVDNFVPPLLSSNY
eukprot:7589071-Ditylum_brightwellii.AAC.1